MKTGAISWGSPVNRLCGLNTGLVSWWLARRGIGGGTFYDIAGLNHGTLTNGPTWGASTRLGGRMALTLDGSSQYGAFSSITFGANTGYTIACWVKMAASPPSFNQIVGVQSGDSDLLRIFTSGGVSKLNATTTGSSSANTSLSVGVWYHAAATRSIAGAIKLYVNGVDDTGTTDVVTSSKSIDAFSYVQQFSRYFKGDMDDIRIYNMAKNDSEIFAITQDSLAGYPLTLNRLERRLTNLPNSFKPWFLEEIAA